MIFFLRDDLAYSPSCMENCRLVAWEVFVLINAMIRAQSALPRRIVRMGGRGVAAPPSVTARNSDSIGVLNMPVSFVLMCPRSWSCVSLPLF